MQLHHTFSKNENLADYKRFSEAAFLDFQHFPHRINTLECINFASCHFRTRHVWSGTANGYMETLYACQQSTYFAISYV